jgi:hypothetical protein
MNSTLGKVTYKYTGHWWRACQVQFMQKNEFGILQQWELQNLNGPNPQYVTQSTPNQEFLLIDEIYKMQSPNPFYAFWLTQLESTDGENAPRIINDEVVDFDISAEITYTSENQILVNPIPINNPNSKKLSQKISNWNLKSTETIPASRILQYSISSSSNLDPELVSQTPGVCLISENSVLAIKQGKCVVVASQGGDERYSPAPPKLLIINLVNSKIVSIVCVKGTLRKVVTGANPKCPAGYFKK